MKPDCWWCCYPFEGESLHFPYAFKSNVFYTTGHFCSWGCLKAYGIERGKLDTCDYVTLMRKRMEGKITPIKKAPSRFCLEKFGGTVTIDEFRSEIPIRLYIPGEVFQSCEINKDYVQISNNKDSTSDLKLKRDKPLEREKSKLETSLGIVRKCNRAAEKGKK